MSMSGLRRLLEHGSEWGGFLHVRNSQVFEMRNDWDFGRALKGRRCMQY
jgi:hypothetical protein